MGTRPIGASMMEPTGLHQRTLPDPGSRCDGEASLLVVIVLSARGRCSILESRRGSAKACLPGAPHRRWHASCAALPANGPRRVAPCRPPIGASPTAPPPGRCRPRRWQSRIGSTTRADRATTRAASSMRRRKVSSFSRAALLAETGPTTTVLCLGNRNGAKPPARSLSYSGRKDRQGPG